MSNTPNCPRPSINYFTKFILRVKRDITVDVTESKSLTDVYQGRFKGGNQTFGEILVAKMLRPAGKKFTNEEIGTAVL